MFSETGWAVRTPHHTAAPVGGRTSPLHRSGSLDPSRDCKLWRRLYTLHLQLTPTISRHSRPFPTMLQIWKIFDFFFEKIKIFEISKKNTIVVLFSKNLNFLEIYDFFFTSSDFFLQIFKISFFLKYFRFFCSNKTQFENTNSTT